MPYLVFVTFSYLYIVSINIDKLRKVLNFRSDKDGSGEMNGDEFTLLAQTTFKRFVERRWGDRRNYFADLSVPQKGGWEDSQARNDDISHLLNLTNLTVNKGFADLPEDYWHLDYLEYKRYTNAECGEDPDTEDWIPIKVVEGQEWASRKGSKFLRPSVKESRVIARFARGMIEFRPLDLSYCRLSYLAIPQEPVWAYTIIDDEQVYDPVNSVDVNLPSYLEDELVSMMLQDLGIYFRDTQLEGYAERRANQS